MVGGPFCLFFFFCVTTSPEVRSEGVLLLFFCFFFTGPPFNRAPISSFDPAGRPSTSPLLLG